MIIELPEVGRIAEIPLRNGTVRFAKVLRHASDARDWRRCSSCGNVFSFGPIGEHCVTGKLVCLVDCTK
jgi:hypothetical protein